MKYLNEAMTQEEARKTYRHWAMKLHPDVGGDEEEFKILSNEYTTIIKRETDKTLSLDDLQNKADSMIVVIQKTLLEIYPRTKLVLVYDFRSIEVEIDSNISLPKMLHIEEIIKQFHYPFEVTLMFARDGSKKHYSLHTVGSTVRINMRKDEVADMSNAKDIYSGRRYKIKKSRSYSLCSDLKTGLTIYMRNTPKFSLMTLLGLS